DDRRRLARGVDSRDRVGRRRHARRLRRCVHHRPRGRGAGRVDLSLCGNKRPALEAALAATGYPRTAVNHEGAKNTKSSCTKPSSCTFVSFVSSWQAVVHEGFRGEPSFEAQMLIPSIDLQGGAVVQLVQGERLAIKDEDVFRWVRRFERFPKVQVIDLEAAMGTGDNLAIVRQIAGALSCRVGGGIRTTARAGEVLAAGARQ